jgi:Cu/Zn superoxide dismutase
MKRILVGALGLGVLTALAVSGAAVAHLATASYHRSPPRTDAAAARAHAGRSSVSASPSRAQEIDIRSLAHVRVYLRDVDGTSTGQVDITPLAGRRGSLLTVTAWNLTPGIHTIDLHTPGRCDTIKGKPFGAAGGLLNVTGMANGTDASLLPDLMADANGRVSGQFVDTRFTIPQLAGTLGSVLILHATAPAPMNGMTPAPGARIACGVVFPDKRVRPTPTANPMGGTAPMMPSPMGGGNAQPPTMTAPQPKQSTILGHHF